MPDEEIAVPDETCNEQGSSTSSSRAQTDEIEEVKRDLYSGRNEMGSVEIGHVWVEDAAEPLPSIMSAFIISYSSPTLATLSLSLVAWG